MKKFIFILVAALAAVSLNAAGNAMADRLANATPTPMTNFQKATPELYQKFLNRHKAAPRKVEQTTLYKGYAWESAECTSRSETYDISAGTAINLPVIISAGPGTDSVLITGMEPYFPLQGKFYADYDQIEIPNGQVVYTHSTYGDCGLNSSFYFEGDEEDEAGWYTYGAVWGEVLDDGSISFEDQYLSMSILSGTYAGYRLGNFIYGGTLTPDNTVGRMEIVDLNADNFSSPDVPTSTIPVTLNQEGAVVTVGNFGKWGTVDVNLLADRTLAIPSQLIYEGGSTYGDFYTRAANYTVEGASALTDYLLEDPVIYGEATPQTLVLNSFMYYSTNKYYTGEFIYTATIYNEGEPFLFPPQSLEITADGFEDLSNIEVNPTETVQLHAVVLPEGSLEGVEWSSSDETLATVDENGLVTILEGNNNGNQIRRREGADDVTTVIINAVSTTNPDAAAEVEIKILKTVTGVADLNAGKAIQAVKYYNAAGIESNMPFDGLNIVVSTYTDGTRSIVKIVK